MRTLASVGMKEGVIYGKSGVILPLISEGKNAFHGKMCTKKVR